MSDEPQVVAGEIVVDGAVTFRVRVSDELVRDSIFDPSSSSAGDQAEREELRAAGLLNAAGDQIGPNECPAIWRFPPDGLDWFCCERPRGHDGSHMFRMIWEDSTW